MHSAYFRTFIFLAAIFFILFSRPALANSNDFQNWSMISIDQNISEKYGYYIELHHRLQNNWDENSLSVIRPSLKYNLNKNISIFLGYDWIKRYESLRLGNEQRIWQQIIFRNQYKKFRYSNAFRLEERFIDKLDPSLRARWRTGFSYPITQNDKLFIDVFNELIVQLTGAATGLGTGLNQNRSSLGINYMINQNTRLRLGYVYNHTFVPKEFDTGQHGLMFGLNFMFD
jgi:opacity protein-like surface antigen